MPSVVAPTYLAGYKGTVSLNGISTWAVTGWSADGDPGLWDATNIQTNGWMWQERGIQKISFTFTIICTAGQPASGGTAAVAAGVPDFKQGDTVTAQFTINGTDAYVGNVIITKFSPKVDLKGGVTFDITADSQGPMTGTLAVTPAGT